MLPGSGVACARSASGLFIEEGLVGCALQLPLGQAAAAQLGGVQGARICNRLMASKQEVPACSHRYLSRISTLAQILRGPECLRPSLEVHGGLAYVVHHLGDITAIPGALPLGCACSIVVCFDSCVRRACVAYKLQLDVQSDRWS